MAKKKNKLILPKDNTLFDRKAQDSFTPVFIFLGLIWLVYIIQDGLSIDIKFLGIQPRAFSGLCGVLFSPLIHKDFNHIFSNSISFIPLGIMLLYFYPKVALKTITIIYFLTGAFVWLLADWNEFETRYHIGASGLIYGFAGFIAASGFLRYNARAISLTLIVLFFYSGFIWGVLPTEERISWESHLFGLFSGVLCAVLFKNELELEEIPPRYFLPENENDKKYFLPRDTFEKTLRQRAEEAELERILEEQRLQYEANLWQNDSEEPPKNANWYYDTSFSWDLPPEDPEKD